MPVIAFAVPAPTANAAAKQQGSATGGISGIVTAAAGGGRVSHVSVQVLDDDDQQVGSASTGADGTYRVTGLPAATPGYIVCFDGSDARGGSSSSGYLDQCYRGVPWDPSDGNGIPSGTTLVRVTAGRLTPAVDAALTAAGGITGTVTAAAGGAGLSNVHVAVFGTTPYADWLATTGPDGTYRVTGLDLLADGYAICFDATDARGGSSRGGYFSQCYRGVPWDPNANDGYPADDATMVPVTAGRLTPAVGAALDAAGGITGTVTAAHGGTRLSHVNVQVFDALGDPAGQAFTGADGTYQVTGLPTAAPGYSVCFDASDATGGNSRHVYANQCYRGVPWGPSGADEPASGATPVPVTDGKLTAAVDAALGAAVGISGTVTAAAGGAGLFGVNVEVFKGRGDGVASVLTGADGTYQITGLPPAASGYLVCFDASGATGGSSGVGYASQCYRNVPWTEDSSPAPGTTPVHVTTGRLTTAVNAALKAGGGISGTVTAADGGAGLSDVDVDVYDSDGYYEGTATTGADGSYQAGLDPAASGYRVCFDASQATGGSSTTGYLSQCYRNVPWAGGEEPAPGATPVPVAYGKLTTAVNAALVAG